MAPGTRVSRVSCRGYTVRERWVRIPNAWVGSKREMLVMRRFYGVVIGLTALLLGGTAQGSSALDIANPLGLNPPSSVDRGVKNHDGFSLTSDTDGVLGFFEPAYGEGWTGFSDGFELSEDTSTAWETTSTGLDRGGSLASEAKHLDDMLVALGRPKASDSGFDPVKVDEAASSITTNREYFWVKHGQWTAYFVNPTPGTALTVNFLKDGQTTEFSHYGVAGVPIPPAFLLFGSALLGMGWLSRRQRARKDRAAEAVAA